MLKKFLVPVALLLVVAGGIYEYRSGKSSAATGITSIVVGQGPRLGDARRISKDATICVNPVLDTREKKAKAIMAGLDEELAAQLRLAGFQVANPGTAAICAATVFTDLVAIEGRNPLKASVDFRVVLLDEQVPRLVSSATGSNRDGQTKLAMVNTFAPVEPDRAKLERAAVVAAFAAQARKIQASQQDGMAAYDGALPRP